MQKQIKAFLQVLLLFVFCQTGVAQSFNYTLIVKVKKPMDKYRLFLYTDDGNGQQRIDSAVYKKGKFIIKSTATFPQLGFFSFGLANTGVKYDYTKQKNNLYIEKGNIIAEGINEHSNFRVAGTSTNEDYQRYLDMLASFEPRRDSISLVKTRAYQKLDSTLMNSTIVAFRKLDEDIKAAERKYVEHNPASLVSLDWLKRTINIPRQKPLAENYFKSLSPVVQNSFPGKRYAEILSKTIYIALGNEAPLFSCNDINDNSVNLKDYRGKYVLIDFWASWCVPCRKENPNLIKAYQEYGRDIFEIVAFSLDTSKPYWTKAVENDKLPWVHISDFQAERSPVCLQYGVSAIPSSFLIDPSGKIVAIDLRGEQLERKLKSLLGYD